MVIRTALFVAAIFVLSQSVARADESPTYTGAMSPAETAFVASVQKDLGTRFGTAADAEKAGYVRYTDADETGAISYANFAWTSADPRHPSQLWYDKAGLILGADFSTPRASGVRPSIFGVNPGRLYEFDDHVHYVLKSGHRYDNYIMADKYRAAGGDPKHPTAEELARMKKAPSAADVAAVFDMPSIWDLIVWVKPNPNGAFAAKNPDVVP